MPRKNFTKATTDVADKFFSGIGKTEDATANPDLSKTSKEHTKVGNKSQHYNARGKREERYGLLLDKQLKDDLKQLSNAVGSKSVNDFIVTVLLEYVENPLNQDKLRRYKEFLQK